MTIKLPHRHKCYCGVFITSECECSDLRVFAVACDACVAREDREGKEEEELEF